MLQLQRSSQAVAQQLITWAGSAFAAAGLVPPTAEFDASLPGSVPAYVAAPVQDLVVRREKVAVLTQGTLTDAEMLAAQPEASYLLALAELPVPGACVPHPSAQRCWGQRCC